MHERADRAQARGDEAPGKRGVPASVSTVLALQRSAGNAAVAALLSPPIAVQRNPLVGNRASDWYQYATGKIGEFAAWLRPATPSTTTTVTYGALTSAGFGTWMLADPLTTDHPVGSEPKVTNDTWERLKRRRTPGGRSSYYIRGHLLNDAKFGGDGETWSNLTPLTGPANNQSTDSHLRLVENPVAAALKPGIALAYRVQALYGRNPVQLARWLRGMFDVVPDDQGMRELRETLYAENYVPTELRCIAWQYDAQGVRTPLLAETVIRQQQFARADAVDDYTIRASDGSVVDLQDRWALAGRVLPTMLLAAGAYATALSADLVRAWCAGQGTTPEQVIIDNSFEVAAVAALWAPILAGGASVVEQYVNRNETPWVTKPAKVGKAKTS